MRSRLPLALTVAAATAALAVMAAPSSPPALRVAAPASGPLLGMVNDNGRLRLARVDPVTLRPRGPRLDVGAGGCAPRGGGEACWFIAPWSLTPGGARLAVARNREHAADSVVLLDRARVRSIGEVRVAGGPVGLVALMRGRRALALQEAQGERQQLLTLDLAHGRVLAGGPLVGSVLRVARTPRWLVTLVADTNAIGPARLEIADRDGLVRAVTLARIRAGVQLVDPAAHRTKHHIPGLTVDRAGRRAFVVAPGLVAEIDLRDLTVRYHALERQRSLLERVREWIDSAAQAKQSTGPVRSAIWLETGAMAVYGAGLSLVDTRRWTVSDVDRRATDVRRAGDLLLATGAKRGLIAYGVDGGERFRLFDRETVFVSQVYAGRAYVGAAGRDRLRVVDLAAGRAVGELVEPIPWLVGDQPASWWE
jgi:hypothetical protein